MTKDNVDDIRTQFTRQADAYAESAQAKDEAAHTMLVEICKPTAESHVLDVACGPGFLTMAFARYCKSVVGLDATAAMLSMAKAEAIKRGLSNVRFEEGLATDIPFPPASFDIVSCRAAFHHFPQPDRVLAEMRRVLKQDGKILIADTVTSEDPREDEVHNAIERLCDPTHVKARSRSEFHQLLQTTGLEIVTELPGRITYDLDGWILHGGPSPEVEKEIRRRFDEALKEDKTGLRVRTKGEKILFTHQTVILIAALR